MQRRLRLETGGMHQCNCAREGRAHIINGSLNGSLFDFSKVEESWGKAYTARAQTAAETQRASLKTVSSTAEFDAVRLGAIFGLHSVYCPFHRSGPCTLGQVEAGIASLWSNNFSRGYHPLMDNNLMLWTESIGPLLDAFLRDGVDFYPMVWQGGSGDVYSVLVSPCGRQLIEIAAPDCGGRGFEQFHVNAMARAIFRNWNRPADWRLQPLVPLRISRAIGKSRFDSVLAFYGAGRKSPEAVALGFGQSAVVADEVDPDTGDRAVTLLLSPQAKVHLQLWSRPESVPGAGVPPLPSAADFEAAAAINQLNGRGPTAPTYPFCTNATGGAQWTVERYTMYMMSVHETVMTPPPTSPATDPLPYGASIDVFIDDHMSWDCTSPRCNMEDAARSLYSIGSRVQWLGGGGLPALYSYDPAGYGLETHWFNLGSPGFAPAGIATPNCFNAWPENGTCPGAFLEVP